MTEVTNEINNIICDNADFSQVVAHADLPIESVVWADDVAILIATWAAKDPTIAIEDTLQKVHEFFAKRGFTLNLQKGKTSVVATFRGPGV